MEPIRLLGHWSPQDPNFIYDFAEPLKIVRKYNFPSDV